jgi:hypothetical protein
MRRIVLALIFLLPPALSFQDAGPEGAAGSAEAGAGAGNVKIPDCTNDENGAAKAAAQAGVSRVQTALGRMQNIPRPALKKGLQKVFDGDVDPDLAYQTIVSIGNMLNDPNLWFSCPKESRDKELFAYCGSRAAFVINQNAPVFLCPSFFASGADQRTRTIVHESAHLIGIGNPQAESYCVLYTCNLSCGAPKESADGWSQAVHCLSGQTPDKDDDVYASR